MANRLFLIFLTGSVFSLRLSAQVELSAGVQQKLDEARIEFLEPLEATYKDIRMVRNDYLDYDFAIRSRREQIEIRFLIEPLKESNPVAYAPHVRTVRMLMHLARNDDAFVMSGIDVRETDLQEQFNADWGKIFFFTPKEGFSRYKECKMVALFREGQGMAYVFFLFDKPSRALDNRFYALRFMDEMN
jgi:hypothetical protein